MKKINFSRIHYDAKTGIFTWLRPASHRVLINSIAGSYNDSGYIIISLDGVKIRAHRLAWRITYGYWPIEQIDHINGIRDDNRICNLREATNGQNRQNIAKRKDNKSGFIGVYYAKWANAWRAEIRIAGVRQRLGYFETPELAHKAYAKAKAELHIFHPEVPQR